MDLVRMGNSGIYRPGHEQNAGLGWTLYLNT